MKRAIIADRVYSLEKEHDYYEAIIIEDERIISLTTKKELEEKRNNFAEIDNYNGIIIPELFPERKRNR